MPLTNSSEVRKPASFRSRKLWIVSIWGIAIAFGVAVRLGWMPAMDLPLLTWIRDHQLAGLQRIMYIITVAGTWPFYIGLLLLLALILIPKKQLRDWLILALDAGLTFAVNNLLKVIFQRGRPLDFFQISQGGSSFPSGHAMVAVAFYLLAALMLAKAFPRLKWLAAVIGAVSFLPGLSRLFMGVHYPTDVVLGWLLGVSAAFFWYEVWLQPEMEKSILRLAKKSLFHN
ncbi:MAG: phosphatase PAP2 family protein [Clostridiaceae bacterium]|nr:phosphatase PAP2 family protein [Clostridiaceae bacterium]